MGLPIALYIIIWRVAAGIHIHEPNKVAAVTGNPVTIYCRTNKFQPTLLWYFLGVVDDKEILIFNGLRGLPRITVKTDNLGFYELRIENVTELDAGSYRCVVKISESGGTRTDEEFSSDLTVLDSDPTCKTNASSDDYQGRIGDTLLLYCTFDYTGNWSPSLEWSRNDEMNITTMSKVIQHNNSISSTLTLSLKSDDNEVTFTCKTTFIERTEIHEDQVTYVKTHTFAWNFTVNLLFGPQRIEISPNAESYSPNDRLYCAADGNPNPSCIWIDLDANKEVVKGCLLLIDENMKRNRKYDYQCRAENTIAGVKHFKATNITFRIIDPWTVCQYSIIGVAVGSASAGILLSLIVTSIRKRIKRKCCDNTSKDHSTEVPSSTHEYESVSDSSIQMNQPRRDQITIIGHVEEEEKSEEDKDGNGEDVELNIDIHATTVIDAVTSSALDAHSHSLTRGDYSSLKVRRIIQHQHAVYSQLDVPAPTVAEVN